MRFCFAVILRAAEDLLLFLLSSFAQRRIRFPIPATNPTTATTTITPCQPRSSRRISTGRCPPPPPRTLRCLTSISGSTSPSSPRSFSSRTSSSSPASFKKQKPRRGHLYELLPLALFAAFFTALAVRAETLWSRAPYTGSDATALQVEVTAQQFAWTFRYPGVDATFGRTLPSLIAPADANPLGLDPTDLHAADDVVTSQLVLPANRAVDLRLRALDVMHGFSVPALRLKQNAVPGQTIHIHFTPTTPGEYAILCTQICGSGHYRMAATLRILPPETFNTWLNQQPHFSSR